MKSLIPSTIVHLLWAMTNQMTVTSTLKLISYPQGNPSSRSLLHTLVSQGKYNPIQLDPSAFYTIAFFAALGPLYSAHRVYLDADTLVFSFLQGREFFRLKAIVFKSIYKGLVQSATICGLFAAAYSIFGIWCWRWTLGMLHMIGYIVPKQKFSFFTVFDIGMQLGLFFTAALFIASAEIVHDTFNIVYTMKSIKKHSLAELAPHLEKKNIDYNKYLAFLELYDNAFHHEPFRRFVFDHVKPDGQVSYWQLVQNSCTAQIESFISILDENSVQDSSSRMKKHVMDSLKDVKRPPPIQPNINISPSKMQSSIYLHQKKSFLENATNAALKLITEPEDQSSIAKAAEPLAFYGTNPTTTTSKEEEEEARIVPDVLLPSRESKKPILSFITPPRVKTVPGSKDFLTLISKYAAQVPVIGEAIVCESVEFEIAMVLKDVQLVVWALQVLARMVVASTSEDKYGQVQVQVPKILTLFTTLHTTLEKYLKSKHPSSQPKPLSAPFLASDRVPPLLKPFASVRPTYWRVVEPVTHLSGVVEGCIYQICAAYYGEMDQFRFPANGGGGTSDDFDASVVEKLQRFVTFS